MEPMRPTPAGWTAELWARACARGWWKMTGTMAGMVVFFAAYLYLLRHPLFRPTVMPLTPLDRWIGFEPAALVLYVSLWPYVALAPVLLVDARDLAAFAVAWIVLGATGLTIFLFWPTAIPPADVDWAVHPHFGFLKHLDAAGNACPSLHVAFAVFTAAWFRRLLAFLRAGPVIQVVNWLWCGAILYSTVATRQHVVIDVVAGALLGLAVAFLHQRLAAPTPRR